MTRYQKNRLAMFQAVKKVSKKYTDDVNSIPSVASVTTEINGNTDQIVVLMGDQEKTITGRAIQKQKEEDEMIDATIQMCGALHVYALDNDDLDLANLVDIGPYNLIRKSDTSLFAFCNEICSTVEAIGAEPLATYGVLAEDITNLRKEVTDFGDLVAEPRAAIINRSKATKMIATLIKTNGRLLEERLDKLMPVFKRRNPEFYLEYQSARIVVDLRTTAPSDAEMN